MNTGIAEEIRKQWLIDGTALVARLNSGANELHVAGAIVGAGIMVILRDEIGTGRFDAKESDQFQQLREELEQRTNERNEAAAHAIGWKSICDELRSELAEKNKVLEWYGSMNGGFDIGQTARSILSQYATINESKPEPDTAAGSSAT